MRRERNDTNLVEGEHLTDHLAAVDKSDAHTVHDLRGSQMSVLVQVAAHRAVAGFESGRTYVSNLETVHLVSNRSVNT